MKILKVIYNDLKNYGNSLLPQRWIGLFIFILLFSFIIFMYETMLNIYDLYLYLYIVLFNLIIDYTIGYGRSERNIYKNITGFIISIFIIYAIFKKMEHL